LTPVFFFVVEWLSELRIFKSGPLRRLSDMVLGIVSFRALRGPLKRKPRVTVPGRAIDTVAEPGELVEHK
jgi:hypothetical protein